MSIPTFQHPRLGDNSNTQFAVIGLWVARRHHAQVDDALKRVAEYFRNSVKRQGRASGWGYTPPTPPTPSMTCAGLIAIATQHGLAQLQAGAPGQKPNVRREGNVVAKKGKDADRGSGAATLEDPLVQGGLNYLENHLNEGADQDWYFHWSLERVAVIYDLPRIGAVDWYEWCCQIALNNQQADGSWRRQWGQVPETAFVLLVLNRANVTSDLTRLVGGQSNLQAGADIADLQRRAQAAPVAESVPEPSGTLVDQIVKGKPKRQRELINELRDKKGAESSNTLTEAVEALQGEMKDEARRALAERFTRLTPKSLKDKLKSESSEARMAAANAAASKKSSELVLDLIDLLTDKNPGVAQAALTALKSTTSQDFGPSNPNASLADRFAAQKRWKAWASEK